MFAPPAKKPRCGPTGERCSSTPLPSTSLVSSSNEVRLTRTVDLRNTERFSNFNASRFKFKARTAQDIYLDTHHWTPSECVDLAHRSVEKLLTDCFRELQTAGVSDDAIVHIYLSADGMDDFTFNHAGEESVRFGYLKTLGAVDNMVDGFSRIIQSGKEVILNDKTTVQIMVYEPPTIGGATYYQVSYDVPTFIKKSSAIVQIVNPKDKMCMARAIVVGMYYTDSTKTKTEKRMIRNPKKQLQAKEALDLCLRAGVDPTERCTTNEMEKFASVLNVNIHIWTIQHGIDEFVAHSAPKKGQPHIYLMHSKDHYDCITNIDTVLRSYRNMKRWFCEECCSIVAGHRKGSNKHQCNKSKTTSLHCIDGEYTKYRPSSVEVVELPTEDGYMERAKPKDKIDSSKVLYFDLETYPRPYDKITGEPVLEFPMDLTVEETKGTQPYPFVEPCKHELYDYKQEMVWCEVQSGDGEIEETFQKIEEFLEFLQHPDREGCFLIAHYGSGFDFHFLYEAMFGEDKIVQGRLTAPIMDGQKIKKGYFWNNITLLDSYSFFTAPLASFPGAFGLEEGLMKGDFPFKFIHPGRAKKWDKDGNLIQRGYEGPYPDIQYYSPDEKNDEKRAELIAWHTQMVEQGVEFDYHEEMKKYCHSDVTILRLGFEKFRDIFTNMKTAEGMAIGIDPLNYLSAPGLAYDGIWKSYFMPEHKICYQPRKNHCNASKVGVLWLNYEMEKRHCFIRHALNHPEGEYRVSLPGNSEVSVDGYCEATNTIFQFHGCYWHSHPKCYEGDEPHPQKLVKVMKNGKWETIRIQHGQNHANTLKMNELLKKAGYTVVTMWECDWLKLQKSMKNKKSAWKNLEMGLERKLPIEVRDAYFGGRTNAYHLYKKCEPGDRIEYLDITSMYPYCMSREFTYPIHRPEILRPDDPEHQPVSVEELFGFMKCKVVPPNDLFHPVLPQKNKDGKVTFPLVPMVGTWASVELQKAVSMGYEIAEVYEQYHYPDECRSNLLFEDFIQTFYAMKADAKAKKNKAMEKAAKLVINSFYGKFGFNISNCATKKIITSGQELWESVAGKYSKVDVDIINKKVSVATLKNKDEYTEHKSSNVAIAAFVTAYARLELYKAMDKLGENCLYSDTDSVIAFVPRGTECPIELSPPSQLGGWTSELEPVYVHPETQEMQLGKKFEGVPAVEYDDFYTEFVSAGPKTYALRSKSGLQDVCKSKGFTLHHNNKKIFNFDSLKEQVLARAMGEDKAKLVMHQGEDMMRRDKFRMLVKPNAGKRLNMVYDKRGIMKPKRVEHDVVTLPLGHKEYTKQSVIEVLTTADSKCLKNANKQDLMRKIMAFV